MTRKDRAFKALCKRIKKRFDSADRNWQAEVKDINNFIAKYGCVDKNTTLWNKDLENATEGHIFRGAWILDRLHGHSGVPGVSNYKGSISRSLRKILGYNE